MSIPAVREKIGKPSLWKVTKTMALCLDGTSQRHKAFYILIFITETFG